MNVDFTLNRRQDQVESLVLHHPNGYQLRVTPGPNGFVLHSSEGLDFEQLAALRWEVVPGLYKNVDNVQ